MLKKLFRRTRDVMRRIPKPVEHVSSEEWEKIMDRAVGAEKFFKSDIYKMMEDDLNTAKELILTNRIHEEREVHIVTDLFQRIITKPRKEQMDELVGKIKYIRGVFDDMQMFINEKVDKEKMEGEGKTIIDRNNK